MLPRPRWGCSPGGRPCAVVHTKLVLPVGTQVSVFGCPFSLAPHSLQRRVSPSCLGLAAASIWVIDSLFNPWAFSPHHPSFLPIFSRTQILGFNSRKVGKGVLSDYFSQTTNTTFLLSTLLPSPGDRTHD